MAFDAKKWMIVIIVLVVLLVVVMSIIGSTSNDLINAGNSITDANNCSITKNVNGVGHVYNITDKYCYNTTAQGGGKVTLAGQFDLPLNSLFGSTGAVLLVLMAMLFIVLIGISLRAFVLSKR